MRFCLGTQIAAKIKCSYLFAPAEIINKGVNPVGVFSVGKGKSARAFLVWDADEVEKKLNITITQTLTAKQAEAVTPIDPTCLPHSLPQILSLPTKLLNGLRTKSKPVSKNLDSIPNESPKIAG